MTPSTIVTARPIRVGFVLHVMDVAGAEMLVTETIERLRGALDPAVFCLDGIGRMGERLRAAGVPVVALGRRPGLDVKVAARLAREIDRRHIDVLHAHQYTPFFYTALARLAARRRVHLVFTEHGRHYPDVVSARRRTINRWLLSRLADEVTAVCGFSARSLRDADGFSRRPIDIVENGIDVRRHDALLHVPFDRRALRLSLGLEPSRQYIVSVARFHPVKDHATLLGAFARVAAARPEVDLLLAGDGPLRAQLESLARSLNVDQRVRFLGVRDDVPDLLHAADVFALTSVSEAASLTLLDAMASGLPVVVTAVGGNPEIVRDGVEGVLVPRGDEAATADALRGLLEDPVRAHALGAAGRARVRTQFRLEDTVQKYYERYAAAAARLGVRDDWQAVA